MAKKIVKMTRDQEARIPEWVEEWSRIGLSCEPANFDEAERGVRGCYRAAGLKEPEVVLRVASPFAAVCAGPIATLMLRGDARNQVYAQADAQVYDHVRDQVYALVSDQVCDQVRDQVRDQVSAQVSAQVDDQVYDHVRAQVYDQVYDQVDDQVYALVRAQVYAQVSAQVSAQVRAQVSAQVYDQADAQVHKLNCKAIRDGWRFYRGGNLWAGWYAYTTFMRDVLGLSGGALDGFQWDELHARNAGWCWYGDRVAVISDRPDRLLFDENGGLHCDDGMAARWRDGWGLWMIHGIRVDEQIVMRPEAQTIEQINQEENADIKSIRIERFGWARYLKESRSKLLDHRHNDIENTMEALYDAPDGSRRLVATCPTGRVFVMGCPSDVQTCAQAQNWLGGDELDAKSRCLGRT